MKKLYLLGIALLAATFAFAQVATEKSTKPLRKASGIQYTKYEPIEFTFSKKHHSTAKDANAVLFEDFSDETFPPTGWAEECKEDSSEYTPRWVRGHDLAFTTNHTVHPGDYAFIDYSDTVGQNEWLITPTLQIPENAILQFDVWALFRYMVDDRANFSSPYDGNYADFNVLISTDDGNNWVRIWNEDTAYVNGVLHYQDINEGVMVDLSQYANQQTVKLAFQYVGMGGSYLYIDNVTVTAASTTAYFELSEAYVKTGNTYINFRYNGMFTNIPRSEISTDTQDSTQWCTFEAVAQNHGFAPANVKLVYKVYNPADEVIFTYTYPTVTLPAASFDENGTFVPSVDTIVYYTYDPSQPQGSQYDVNINAFFFMHHMTENGTYRFEATLEPAEGTYENPNGRTVTFNRYTTINDDCLYSRDLGNASDSYSLPITQTQSYTISKAATTYQIYNPEDIFNSAEAYIKEATAGTVFHYEIMDADMNEQLLVTEPYTVPSDFTPGFVKLYSEEVLAAEDLTEGDITVVIFVDNLDDGGSLRLGMDQTAQPNYFENLYYYVGGGETGWFIIGDDGDFMIRLYTCEQTNPNPGPYVDTFEANEIEMFPNPTTGIVNFNNVENAKIEVYNMMGQVVANANSNSVNTTIDLSNLANGNYVVRIVKDGEVATSKLNIAR